MNTGGSAYQLEWVAELESPAPAIERTPIASLSELDARLDQIAAQAEASEPLIAELVDLRRGGSLGIGLGRAGSVLAFKRSDLPPYYQSTGGTRASSSPNDFVVFYYQGQWTEFPARAVVSNESAREAMRIFFGTGERPENILWEDV